MAARRPRKTNHGVSDFDALLNAIKAVLIDAKSKTATAKQFNINMRSFCRYLDKFKDEVPDINAVGDDELLKVVRRIATYSGCGTKLVFDEDQETALIDCVIKYCQHGLSITEIRQLAYQFVKNLNIAYPASWDAAQMAGKQWYYGFMLRHKALTLRTPEQTNLNGVKGFCRENDDDFCRNLDEVKAAYPYSPSPTTSLSSEPSSVGPLRVATPQKKSNRGPKPRKTNIWTFPESIAVLNERQGKRAAAKEKQGDNQKKKVTPAKRTKKKASTSSEDSDDDCIICS